MKRRKLLILGIITGIVVFSIVFGLILGICFCDKRPMMYRIYEFSLEK
jgi:hypothetical protein